MSRKKLKWINACLSFPGSSLGTRRLIKNCPLLYFAISPPFFYMNVANIQISNYNLQISNKLQVPMAKTIGISVIGIYLYFGICDLEFLSFNIPHLISRIPASHILKRKNLAIIL